MTTTTRRIAVVGIDGSGKSSVVRRLGQAASNRGSFAAITCPHFHDTPNAPLQSLSRQLKAFSDQANVLGNPVIKASALYLQMTLYGPVERFFVQTFQPSVLVCERHPMIESMVYGPLYVQLAANLTSTAEQRRTVRDRLDSHAPGTMDAIQAWHAQQTVRLGEGNSLWDVLGEVAELITRGPAAAIAGFAKRYQTTLPDDVIWLDIAPEQAARRCGARAEGQPLEAHETPESLAALRRRYLQVQEIFAERTPAMRFHCISTGDGMDLDESVRACVARARLPLSV
jgi:thymidylate kinase